jgi:hypothetical protein
MSFPFGAFVSIYWCASTMFCQWITMSTYSLNVPFSNLDKYSSSLSPTLIFLIPTPRATPFEPQYVHYESTDINASWQLCPAHKAQVHNTPIVTCNIQVPLEVTRAHEINHDIRALSSCRI